MKKIQNVKTMIFLLGISALVASCEKDVFQSTPSNQPVAPDVQSELQEIETGERLTGCNLLSPVEYNKIQKSVENLNIQAYPATKFLNCPPVKNQGSEGSCVGFGTAYAARSIMEKYKTGNAYSYSSNIFSPEYVYNQIKVSSDCGSGSHITAALNMFQLAFGQGVSTWNSMPYSSTNGCSIQPNNTQKNNASNYKILMYLTVSNTVSAIKNELSQNKAVIVGGPVDVNFQNLGNNVVYSSYNSSKFVGNHCYCVIGWDDSKNAFKVMNSWGTTWGTSGFGWINYNIIGTMFKEAYVML